MSEFQKIGDAVDTKDIGLALIGQGPSVNPEHVNPDHVNPEHCCECGKEPWGNKEWYCDGSGYLFSHQDGSVTSRRCPNWSDRNIESLTDLYLASIYPEEGARVMAASRERGALKISLDQWGFSTPAVLLAGGVGVGKTIAGHVIAIDQIKRKRFAAHFIPTTATAQVIKNSALGNFDQKFIARGFLLDDLRRCGDRERIIFIDDLGRERQSDAVAQEVADQIRALYASRSTAIISTNLNLQGIADRYGDDVADRLREEDWIQAVNCGKGSLR